MLTFILLLGCKTAPDFVGTWEGTCAPSGDNGDLNLSLSLRAILSSDGYAGFVDVDDGTGPVELTFEAEERDTRVGIAIFGEATGETGSEGAPTLWIFAIRDVDVLTGTCGYPTDDDRFTCTLGCEPLKEAEKLSLTGEADLVRVSKPTGE